MNDAYAPPFRSVNCKWNKRTDLTRELTLEITSFQYELEDTVCFLFFCIDMNTFKMVFIKKSTVFNFLFYFLLTLFEASCDPNDDYSDQELRPLYLSAKNVSTRSIYFVYRLS